MSLLLRQEKVRRLLKLRKWQEESDRALARHLGVSPATVERVRRQLIHAGLIPAGYGWDNARKQFDPDRPRYRPYAPARGGFVWTPDGRTVRADRLKDEKAMSARLRRPAGSAAPPPPA